MMIEQIDSQLKLPDYVMRSADQQRLEQLQQRFARLRKQIDDIRKKHVSMKTPTQYIIDTLDQLIQRVRAYEEQIQSNLKRPIVDYENAIDDCQVS
jgi:DNA-binding transcriptional MerR regulator